MNVQELAERDLAHILENLDASGTPFVLIDPPGNEYLLTGDVGDVSLLIESASGEAFRSRTITAVCRIKTLLEKTPLAPARGWQARIKDVSLYVQGVSPDRTLGLYNLTLGLDLAPPPETVMEAGNE
jgi:hypothetical protein